MPTPITHAIVSLSFCQTLFKDDNSYKFLFWSIFCATIADIDLIGYFLKVPVYNFLGHRGLTHSIFFCFIISLFVCLLFFRNYSWREKKFWWLVFGLFIISLSHPILDAATSEYYGVALLSPLSNYRFAFPWSPVNDNIGEVSFLNYYVIFFWRVLAMEIVLISLSLLWFWLATKHSGKKLDLIKKL